MRYLLDTNVLSEVARPRPNAAVVRWLADQRGTDLAVSVLLLGEIESGVRRMAPGPRRDRLERWLAEDLPERFRHRVLPVDGAVSLKWGRLTAEAWTEGRPLPVIDGLMLATASVHGLALVTRNVRDCSGRGVPILDPWTGESR